MMKVLVTGGSGFCGSHFCADAIRSGWAVHALLRETSSVKQLEELGIQEEVDVHRWNGQQQALGELLGQIQPDVVCHCASLFISEHQPDEVGGLIDSNVRFGSQLLEAMSLAGVDALVNISTSWQYFESQEYRPVNLYAATKEAFRAVIDYYCDARGMKCIDLKLYDVYGRHDPRKKLLPLLKSLADSGKSLEMSAGEQLVELSEVKDVTRAFRVACGHVKNAKAGSYESYGISGDRLSLQELVKLVEKVLGKKLDVHWGARAYRQREVMVPWIPRETLPGWEAEVRLEDGLRNLFETSA
ncbi:MAG: NAD(P)-dependent oxidoreductase [Verrucomicrobiota bacterium]